MNYGIILNDPSPLILIKQYVFSMHTFYITAINIFFGLLLALLTYPASISFIHGTGAFEICVAHGQTIVGGLWHLFSVAYACQSRNTLISHLISSSITTQPSMNISATLIFCAWCSFTAQYSMQYNKYGIILVWENLLFSLNRMSRSHKTFIAFYFNQLVWILWLISISISPSL